MRPSQERLPRGHPLSRPAGRVCAGATHRPRSRARPPSLVCLCSAQALPIEPAARGGQFLALWLPSSLAPAIASTPSRARTTQSGIGMLLRPASAREQSYCTFSPHLPTTDACLGGHPFTGASTNRLMPSSRCTAGDHGISLIRRHSLGAVGGGHAAFSDRPRREGSRLPGVLDARLPPERFSSPTNRAGVAAKALYRLDWTREYPPRWRFSSSWTVSIPSHPPISLCLLLRSGPNLQCG
jgi:hypothetical protein